MTTFKWTPQPASYPATDTEALILSQEGETGLTATITAERLDSNSPAPGSISWEMPQGLPAGMSITVNQTTLTINVADWRGFFPPEIEYLENGQNHQATDFDQVNGATADIYAYRPDAENIKYRELIVTATAGIITERVSYTITVYANYDIGRDLLKAKVEERRQAQA